MLDKTAVKLERHGYKGARLYINREKYRAKHKSPHIHAWKGGKEVSVLIDPSPTEPRVIAGDAKCDAAKLAIEWLDLSESNKIKARTEWAMQDILNSQWR